MKSTQSRAVKILVVEDDTNIRNVMRDLLKMHGYEVYLAADGENGLKYLQSDTYDLLISDLGLPGISGWDLARAARRHQADIVIMVISSWQGKKAEQKMAECGIDKVIWKPFRFDEIITAINKLGLPGARKSPARG